MSEYWVSQAKHYCKVCNTWIADNKVNRQNHDASVKHKQNLDVSNKKKRDDKLYGLRNEEDLKRQLVEIEKAANAALNDDRKQVGDLFASSSGTKVNSSSSSSNYVYNRPKVTNEDDEASAKDTADRKESNGFYIVRGQGYLEGELNEGLLVANSTCQVFVEELDDWTDAVIVGRKEIHVPHTEITIKTFTVDYKTKDKTTNKDVWVRDESIRSDKLRILATTEGEPTELDGTSLKATVSVVKPQPSKPQPKPKINETTGISGWQTVSVVMVDEVEVERQRLEEEARATEELKVEKEKLVLASRANAVSYDNYDLDESEMTTYKGIPLSRPTLVDAGAVNLSGEEVITFKKRKLVSEDDRDGGDESQSSKVLSSISKAKKSIRKRSSDED